MIAISKTNQIEIRRYTTPWPTPTVTLFYWPTVCEHDHYGIFYLLSVFTTRSTDHRSLLPLDTMVSGYGPWHTLLVSKIACDR